MMDFLCMMKYIGTHALTNHLMFQIPVKVDLPVGQNLMDHACFFLPISINTSIVMTEDKLKSTWELVKYLSVGKGE